MCADTANQEEEEKDPSDGLSDYDIDRYYSLSELSTGKSYTRSFSPITNTTGGTYNQYPRGATRPQHNLQQRR